MTKENEINDMEDTDDISEFDAQAQADQMIDEIEEEGIQSEDGDETLSYAKKNSFSPPPAVVGKKAGGAGFAAIYRLTVLGICTVTMILAICILVKVSRISGEQDRQVINELDNALDRSEDAGETGESGENNEDEQVLDSVAVSDEELTLEIIQKMSNNTIIDTYLISKTNARRHSYDTDNLIQEDGFWRYEENGRTTSQIGVDVSSYQGDIDWKKVKSAGIQFAIIRVGIRGYGTGKLAEDEKFKTNIEGAIKAGLDVGVYFFSQAITTKEAVEEAEFVYDLVKKYDLKYPVAYDSEQVTAITARTNKANLTAQSRTQMAIAFCDYIESKGLDACIYSNKRWFLRNLNLEELDKHKIWLAQYSTTLDFPFHFGMWQYTDKGRVDGIDGDVDIDIYFSGDNW